MPDSTWRPYRQPIIGYRKNGAPIRLCAGGAATDTDLLPQSMDDLRGRTPEDMRKMVDVLDAHLKALHQNDNGELRDLDSTEQSAFDLGMTMRSELMDRIEEHDKIAATFRKRPEAVQTVYANLRAGLDDPYADVLRLSPSQARDRALHALEGRDASDMLTGPQRDQVERFIRRDHVTARRILVTENEAYRSAWMKLVTEPQAAAMLSDEERNAVRAWQEFRAMGDWTTTAGGFGIPVKLAA